MSEAREAEEAERGLNMGQSTDGILFYGYLLNQGEEPWRNEKNSDDYEEWIASLYGVTEPSHPYTSGGKAYQAYWEAKREVIKACGIEVVAHCHSDDPMYGLALRSRVFITSRGSGEPIAQADLVVMPLVDTALLDAFVQLAKLKREDLGPCGWFLVSYCG